VFEIEQELVQQVVNYLAGKPWAEVHVMIHKLAQLKLIPPSPTDKKSEIV
jgi:hypothetical protein